jgi:3-dehydroquinate synthase
MIEMNNTAGITCRFEVPFEFRVLFTEGVFDPPNDLLRQLLGSGGERRERLLAVIDASVIAAMPELADQLAAYLAETSVELVCPPVIYAGGELLKNQYGAVTQLYGLIERHGLSRHSFVAAIGGGALLDVVGFAAATAHRGIRHIRFPTTTLSQADGGVGVKNAINAFGKKNFIGTFAPPFAVINDSNFLHTLPASAKAAGYIEGVKVGLIRDAEFFFEIENMAEALKRFELAAMRRLIRRSAELHVKHIAQSGDPFERGSARPLDFGHWAAHKLEQLTSFQLSHGEAVAIGIALDVIYSRDAGHLSVADATRILALIHRLGFAAFVPEMLEIDTLLVGLDEFREHLGGELTITLLRGIGRGFEVHEISRVGVTRAIEGLRERNRALAAPG